MNTRPEALRWANILEHQAQYDGPTDYKHKAAAELRRLALKQWAGLTDEEIQELSYLYQKIDASNSPWFDRLGFAKAIEQALKDKNT